MSLTPPFRIISEDEYANSTHHHENDSDEDDEASQAQASTAAVERATTALL